MWSGTSCTGVVGAGVVALLWQSVDWSVSRVAQERGTQLGVVGAGVVALIAVVSVDWSVSRVALSPMSSVEEN